MKHQQGNLYLYGAIGIVALALISGLVWAYKSHVEHIAAEAKKQGVAEERARWLERENTELTAANNTIAFLNEAYRKREADWGRRLNIISADYQKELQRVQAQRERDIADAVAGAVVLRDPGPRPTPACKDDGGNATATASSAPSGRDGPEGSQLSGAASAFLLGLAGEADAVVVQLGKCQDVILSDRQLLADYKSLVRGLFAAYDSLSHSR